MAGNTCCRLDGLSMMVYQQGLWGEKEDQNLSALSL